MTEAIFGLVGVLVGAFITAWTAYFLARRTEKAKARAAARLLENDLKRMQGYLHAWYTRSEELLQSRPDRAAELRASRAERLLPRLQDALDSWKAYRPLLAEAVLDNKDWDRIAPAYDWLNAKLRTNPGSLIDNKEERAKGRELLDAAIQELERLAGRRRRRLWPWGPPSSPHT